MSAAPVLELDPVLDRRGRGWKREVLLSQLRVNQRAIDAEEAGCRR